MRKIEVIFSQADKELVERLRHKYEKISNRYLALAFVLINYIFQMMHNNCFLDALHYKFIAEHMQEISKYKNSLTFSVSKTCPNAVIYNLPDGKYRCIETVNNIPADGDVIITIKEDADSKGQISLDWYAKTV